MRNSINFNHLESFFSVADFLSFSAAAKNLKISQPVVSRQISQLEDSLDLQLFIRTNKKVRLTPEGEDLYQKTFPLYQEIFNQVEMIKDENQELSGLIAFGCLQEVGQKLFVPALKKFQAIHPKVIFDVRFLKSYEIVSGVQSGDLDIGIVSNKLIHENIRTYKIFDEVVSLITRTKNPRTQVKSLEGLGFVTYRNEDPLLEYFTKTQFPKDNYKKLKLAFRVNSHRSMIDVLQESDYFAVMPKLSVQKEIDAGILKVVGKKKLVSELYLIHQEQKFWAKKNTELREFLLKFMK